jgi:hypothetical protein
MTAVDAFTGAVVTDSLPCDAPAGMKIVLPAEAIPGEVSVIGIVNPEGPAGSARYTLSVEPTPPVTVLGARIVAVTESGRILKVHVRIAPEPNWAVNVTGVAVDTAFVVMGTDPEEVPGAKYMVEGTLAMVGELLVSFNTTPEGPAPAAKKAFNLP